MVGMVRRVGRVGIILLLLPTFPTFQTHPTFPTLQTHPTFPTLQTHPTFQTLQTHPTFPTPLAHQSFTLREPAEVVATLHARCEGCDWGVAAREAAAVTISVDGAYRTHVMLTRGDADSEYRVLLGRYARGGHAIAVAADSSASASRV